MLYRIDPSRETVELIRSEKLQLETTLVFATSTKRYKIANTGQGEGYFSLGGYGELLKSICYVRVLDNIPPERFRLRVQFLDTVDADENVIIFPV